MPMSKPRYKWWGYIRNVVFAYPDLKKEYEELHRQSITAAMGGMPSGTGVSRGTEEIAVRELPPTEQKEYDAVRRAIELTRKMPQWKRRLEIIDQVFWKKRKNLQDAGEAVGYAYKAARDIQSTFLKLVGQEYGYVLADKDKEHLDKLLGRTKRGPASQKNVL